VKTPAYPLKLPGRQPPVVGKGDAASWFVATMVLLGGLQMARKYQMKIIVEHCKPSKEDAVIEAISSIWDWDSVNVSEKDGERIVISGCDYLECDETEDGFVDRLTTAIFKANKSSCIVTVKALCLDDLPLETYSRDERDYARLCKPKPKAKAKK
jgi:hypothetical protein